MLETLSFRSAPKPAAARILALWLLMEGVARIPDSGLDQSVCGLQQCQIGGGCLLLHGRGVVVRDRWF